jgi:hypothetical protein
MNQLTNITQKQSTFTNSNVIKSDSIVAVAALTKLALASTNGANTSNAGFSSPEKFPE